MTTFPSSYCQPSHAFGLSVGSVEVTCILSSGLCVHALTLYTLAVVLDSMADLYPLCLRTFLTEVRLTETAASERRHGSAFWRENPLGRLLAWLPGVAHEPEGDVKKVC